MLAGGALALLTSSANAALVFSLERVPSNPGSAAPSTVLLVARDDDPNSTTAYSIGGLQGRFTNDTTKNGLKFYIPDQDLGDYDKSGGAGDVGFSTRRPGIKGSFLYVPSAIVTAIDGEGPNGNPNDVSDNAIQTNDPRFSSGLWFADFTTSRTSNTTLSAATLHSASGAVLGAAVVGDTDQVTFSRGVLLADGANDVVIPTMVAPVPEPTALCFFGVLGAGTLLRRRRTA